MNIVCSVFVNAMYSRDQKMGDARLIQRIIHARDLCRITHSRIWKLNVLYTIDNIWYVGECLDTLSA